MSSFTEAQKSALSKFVDIYHADPDIRNWKREDIRTLHTDVSKVSLCITWHTEGYIKIEKPICWVPKYLLIAASPTFAEHCSRDPGLIAFTFDVGNMDESFRGEHELAILALDAWFDFLCAAGAEEMRAPTFYSNAALWHIARQLGMGMYLPFNTTELVREAKHNILQPWHITELLYMSSIERNATLPQIPIHDPLVYYLAEQMLVIRPRMRASDKEHMDSWLWRRENAALNGAIIRLRRARNGADIDWS